MDDEKLHCHAMHAVQPHAPSSPSSSIALVPTDSANVRKSVNVEGQDIMMGAPMHWTLRSIRLSAASSAAASCSTSTMLLRTSWVKLVT